MTIRSTERDLPTERFAECSLDDAKPFEGWEPSPQQLERWSLQIRMEREAARLEGMGDDE